ncbi:hypothetical protein RB594_001753 [Gaeumannomyces avenae]
MAELAIGVLGLVPLIGGAHTGVRAAKKKFRSFKKYSSEVRRISNSLDMEKASFRNQTRLVLQLALDDRDGAEKDIEAILGCRDETLAAKLGLEERLQACLADSYEPCRAVFEQIAADINHLEQQLDGYESPCLDMEPERKDRIKAGLKYAFSEAKCKGLLTSLRASNLDLERLRKERLELNLSCAPNSRPGAARSGEQQPSRPRQELDSFLKIRSASRSMHHALATVYAATKTPAPHCARLFIDASNERDSVTNTVMLLCRCDSLLAESRLCLQVLSRKEWVDSGFFTPESTEGREPTRRKVRFADELAPPPPLTPCSANTTPDPGLGQQENGQLVDLGKSASLCADLYRGYQTQEKGKGRESRAGGSGCIGFIDSLDDFRHTFRAEANTKHAQLQGQSGNFMTLDSVFDYDLQTRFTPVDQLRLAHSVSLAFLKFLHTPWMPEIWNTRSLFVLQDRAKIKRCLETLHLRVDISPGTRDCQPSRQGQPVKMEGIEGGGGVNEVNAEPSPIGHADDSDDDADDGGGSSCDVLSTAMLEHGVKSLPLFSLAVVLLQIDRWTRVQESDLAEVRRLAYGSASRLGPRYDKLVFKCLDCEFEARSNTGRRLRSIAKPRLQDSVYREVVCELSDLVRATGAMSLDGEL